MSIEYCLKDILSINPSDPASQTIFPGALEFLRVLLGLPRNPSPASTPIQRWPGLICYEWDTGVADKESPF